MTWARWRLLAGGSADLELPGCCHHCSPHCYLGAGEGASKMVAGAAWLTCLCYSQQQPNRSVAVSDALFHSINFKEQIKLCLLRCENVKLLRRLTMFLPIFLDTQTARKR